MSARILFFLTIAFATMSLSACFPADTHLRHDDQSRSSGEVPGNPY